MRTTTAIAALIIALASGATSWQVWQLRQSLGTREMLTLIEATVRTNNMQPDYSSTFTCDDGTTHTVNTYCSASETEAECLARHKQRVADAMAALCGT